MMCKCHTIQKQNDRFMQEKKIHYMTVMNFVSNDNNMLKMFNFYLEI